MPVSNIYNEGRVVGYSAYEIYVRHSLSENSDRTPATELEWLSSTIAMGSSMLLKVSTDNTSGFHYRDFQFPSNTNLAAANTIIGSFFLGEADCDETGWAQKVTSYGPLLSNNSEESPTTGDHTHSDNEKPLSLTDQLTDEQKDQLDSYMKVVDGLVIQPGEWEATSDTPPKDLKPNLGDYPRVRIYFSDKVEEAFYVLLTGFTLGTVLDGVSGLDGSTDHTVTHPQNGAFLGPGVFPWANKIIFSVPNSYIDAWIKNKYSRKLIKDNVTPADYTEVKVQTLTDIDEESLTDYYGDTTGLAFTIPVDAENAKANNPMNILTVYQRYSVLPPALYASVVDETGESDSTLYPVDVVSPGTVKMYKDDDLEDDPLKTKYEKILDKINALESKAHKNVGLVKSEDSIVWEKSVSTNAAVPVSKTEYDADDSEINDSGVVKSQTGDSVTYALSMGDENGKYATDGSHADVVPASGKVTWDDLITILKENDSLDLLASDRFYEQLKRRIKNGIGTEVVDNEDGTISTNVLLKSGEGIALKQVTEGDKTYITVINDAPNLVDGAGYTTIKQGTHFSLKRFNGFRSYRDDTESFVVANPVIRINASILPSQSTFVFNNNGTNVILPNMIRFTIDASPTSWESDYNSDINGKQYWIGMQRWSEQSNGNKGFFVGDGWDPNYGDKGAWSQKPGFRFRHAEPFTGRLGQYSWIFGFNLDKNVTINIDGLDINLKTVGDALLKRNRHTGYQMIDTTGETSGIWNISAETLSPSNIPYTPRASWSAFCTVNYGFDVEGGQVVYRRHDDYDYTDPDDNRDSMIIIAANSYSDGYNRQFNEYDSLAPNYATSGASLGKYLYSKGMNMRLSFVLYHE